MYWEHMQQLLSPSLSKYIYQLEFLSPKREERHSHKGVDLVVCFTELGVDSTLGVQGPVMLKCLASPYKLT